MSLVQGIITENFVLVGADNRAICPDGSIIEIQNKLIKLNKGIIFGCTGGVLDNAKLFNGYCNYSKELGLTKTCENIEVSYNEFVNIISQNFFKMHEEYINDNKKYEICSMILGFNGDEFEATTFSIGSKHEGQDGIFKAKKAPDFPYKGINAGEPIHMETLHEMVEEVYFSGKPLTILQFKNILSNVFNKGCKIDQTINNNLHFESIRKKDVI